jgi:Protein of unknown function (DUF3302)
MKTIMKTAERGLRRAATRWLNGAIVALPLLLPANAHASIFQGETLDKVADAMAWVVLVVAPIVGIAVFLLIHILPEKIAEKKQHPQVKAIQCLCLLSLAFGGMLWPIAWLWAYTKPVLHQLAYGTDKVAHGEEDHAQPSPDHGEAEERDQLRERLAELDAKLAGKSAVGRGEA